MKQHAAIIVLLIVLITAYLGWLGQLGLRAEEPRRAIVSIEMMENGNYVMPHLMGWPYYNKPPLFNWVMIAFFKLFGSVNEWIVRLPSMLSLLLLAFLNWRLIRKHVDPVVAGLSSLFLLTSADILFYGSVNTGEIDIFFSFLVYLNLIIIYLFLERKQILLLFVLSYLLAAIGFLTKGLPSLAFQGITLTMGLLYFRSFRQFFSWKHLLGILVFIVITGGYLFILHQQAELSGFLLRQIKESSQRTGLDSDFLSTLKGLVENPITLLKISLPWSLSLFGLFNKKLRKKLMTNRLVGYSLLVIAVNIPLYWITGELRARYIYPIIPFLCIVSAMLVYEGYKSIRAFQVTINRAILPFFIALPLALIVAYFIPGQLMTTADKLVNAALILGGGVLAFYFIRDSRIRIYAIVLLMGLARIAMNITYHKVYEQGSRTTILKGHVTTMVKLAQEQEINMTGTPYVFNSTINIMGMELIKGEVVVPKIMSYQVPYYYALYTNRTIKMITDPIPGKLYLIINQDLYKYPGEVLYTYLDISTLNDWNLVKFHGEKQPDLPE